MPFIASWPAKIGQERVSNHVAAAWDIMPTFAEMLGIDVVADGLSFFTELIGSNQAKTHDYLYWEYPEGKGSIAIRMHNWKGVINDVNEGNESMQLFDLNTDPSELFDLAKQYPDIVALLKENIRREHVRPQVEKFEFIFDK